MRLFKLTELILISAMKVPFAQQMPEAVFKQLKKLT